MKKFDRFPHEGVKRYLVEIKHELESDNRYEFGSSGEGEITIRSSNIMYYARKYKRKDGWRLVICKGSKTIYEGCFDSSPSVVKAIRSSEK